jgi:hypothetical protein
VGTSTYGYVRMIKLELEIEAVNDILNVLGQLPTASGAWPLMQRIRAQAEAQVPKEEDKEEA